jgi:carboxyl-terminal processing protease
MRQSLVGIGAVLSEVEEYTTIRELVPGGPAALSNQLQVGDRIVGVGQGENGPVTDILGWRSSDAVELIRGKADTVVMLDILPADAGPDGQHKLVKLVRKTIKLEEQAAKSSIRTVGEGAAARRIGIITLPSFYADFAARQQGRPDARSATRDVARLLQGLKQQKVDSVLIDLRNNGGGSLVEAVELTGLFIDKGPVVQQRDAEGSVTVHSDTDAGVAWDGPLGVLINRASASASEIFAAAIQDYGRGLIIGEPSFGKGTVQSVVDLDRIGNSRTPQYGELRMTIAQFFRINGGTTQLLGVTPDIQFPGSFDPETFGESSYTNALPYTRVKPADYRPAGDLKPLVPMVSALHASRIKKDRDFQDLEEDVAELKRLRARTTVSLNEAERRVERDQQEARLKSRESRADGSKDADDTANKGLAERLSAFRDDGLQPGERRIQEELSAEKARKAARDVLLDEAVNILGDEVRALQTDAQLAARVLPRSAQTLVTQ